MAREQRRLAAIVCADVVGYSRLIGLDEADTLARLKALRRDLIDPRIAENGGRLVKTTGDGLLVEFSSVVDAVRCAIAVQKEMAQRAAGVPPNRRIEFRVGVHMGDIVIDGDDILGDGVNLAARLEALAEPGGVCVSGRVQEDLAGKVDLDLRDGGEQMLKNIARPIRVWHWTLAAATFAPTVLREFDPALPLPDKPSIAVLPFTNMSGDPEQEYFTDGITEDIITDLARFRSLFVIARNSSFTYKGKAIDVKQVGRELGVRYVLEGSIRRAANRVRVTGQLIDTLTGNHIWAERYDRVLEDIFGVQAEVTQAIVSAVAPQIQLAEQVKAGRQRPTDLNAYEIALRAWAHAWEAYDATDKERFQTAIAEAEAALLIDPKSVLALHAMAIAHGLSRFCGMPVDPENSLSRAQEAIARAVAVDGTDPRGYALKSWAAMAGRQTDSYPDALLDARRGHEMNVNDAFNLYLLGNMEAGNGNHERAIECAHQVLRLNPLDPRKHLTYTLLAFASFGARRYADGAQWAMRARAEAPRNRTAYTNLIVCLVGAGEVDRARTVYQSANRDFPDLLGTGSSYGLPEDRRRAQTFLRIAAGLEDPGAADLLR